MREVLTLALLAWSEAVVEPGKWKEKEQDWAVSKFTIISAGFAWVILTITMLPLSKKKIYWRQNIQGIGEGSQSDVEPVADWQEDVNGVFIPLISNSWSASYISELLITHPLPLSILVSAYKSFFFLPLRPRRLPFISFRRKEKPQALQFFWWISYRSRDDLHLSNRYCCCFSSPLPSWSFDIFIICLLPPFFRTAELLMKPFLCTYCVHRSCSHWPFRYAKGLLGA